jgi:integrase/recombinase XerD
MTVLRDAAADYFRLRRALGFALVRDEKLLNQFLDWCEDQDQDAITVAAALAWATLPAGGSANWHGFRLSAVRGFAAWLHQSDPRAEVPPAGLLPHRSRRVVPFLYSDTDIAALFDEARRLRTPLRVATIQTLIGLLSVTGMRIGEVVALDDDDLDHDAGLLLIRHAKFDRQRLVPLHPSTVAALDEYRRERDAVFPEPAGPALLVSSAGTRLLVSGVSVTFARLARRAGFAPRPGNCRPRPHDLRHTFAVSTLLDWYRDGGDVAARLPLLSTYLGHIEPANTYWYLHAAPELLAVAAVRLQAAEQQERR